MLTKIWLKPEQLALYIKQLERFRDLYSQLERTLESDRQGFQFKAGAPNFQTTLSVSLVVERSSNKMFSEMIWCDTGHFFKCFDKIGSC